MPITEEAKKAIESAVDEEHSVFCLEQLGVPVRIINLLHKSGMKTIGDLVSRTESQLLEIPNMGRVQIKSLLDALSRYHTMEEI